MRAPPIIALLYLLLPGTLAAATVDLTDGLWEVDAVLYSQSLGASTERFEDTLLSFDAQLENAAGIYDISGTFSAGGQIHSVFTGLYDDRISSIAFTALTDELFWTAFQGFVDPQGAFMVGALEGLFGSDVRGYWHAERIEAPPIGLPEAAILFVSAMVTVFVIGSWRPQP